jgi:hypothetical protein
MVAINFNVHDLNGNNGFRIEVAQDYYFGNSVSNAGDMNGDGFDDFIIGARGGMRGYLDYDYIPGASYVVFGKASGFDATTNLSDLDGSNGFRLRIEENANPENRDDLDFLGSLVSNAGDVNGDGFDDVIIRASEYTSNGISNSGYVVFGKPSGFEATMNLSNLNGSNGFRLTNEGDDSSTFDFSLSNAGDVNGDGIDDLIIGKNGVDLNGSNSGSSYVVFGKISQDIRVRCNNGFIRSGWQ